MRRAVDMSDDEFTAWLAEKRARVDAKAKEIIDALHAPHSFNHRRRSATVVLLLVMVPERETLMAYRASTNGDATEAVSFPKSLVQPGIICTEADGLFILAKMKAWVAIDRQLKQASMPLLFDGGDWNDKQRAAWKRMVRRLKGAREGLHGRPSTQIASESRKPLLNRNEVA